MNCFYHNGGFIVSDLHVIPTEAIPVSEEEHAALMQAQSEGYSIQPDKTGRPVAVPLSKSNTLETRLAELANIRWQRQTAGIVVDGVPLRTDRDSIIDLREIADRSAGEFPLSYKATTGFVKLATKEQATKYVNAQKAHVQACFEHEATLTAQITALKDNAEALATLDLEKGWPK